MRKTNLLSSDEIFKILLNIEQYFQERDITHCEIAFPLLQLSNINE